MKYEIIEWVNKPTDERKIARYERKALKCAEAFDRACSECKERWEREADEKEISRVNWDYIDFIRNREKGMLERCIKRVVLFWNVNPKVEYSWTVDDVLHLVMTIEEPLLEEARKIVVKINED